MIKKQQIDSIFSKIILSESFKNSKSLQELLNYLIDASYHGKQTKESTIAFDLYNRDNSFNSAEDSIVRSNIHTLRIKLASYYTNEGINDSIQISIPKGHYQVIFTKGAKKKKKISKRSVLSIIAGISLLLLVLTNLYLYTLYKDSYNKLFPIPQDDPVWTDFLNSENNTNIVYGDYFLFARYQNDSERWQEIRDYFVNSKSDLEQYKDRIDSSKIYIPFFTMLPHHSPQNSLDILPVLHNIRKKVSVKRSSSLSLDDLKLSNIIYIGKYKNLRYLKKFTLPLYIKMKDTNDIIHIVNNKNDTLAFFERYRAIESVRREEFESSDYYNKDYALVAKVPGPQNTVIWMFIGIGHISLIESVKLFCSTPSLKEIERQFLDKYDMIPNYFEMLIEVSGYRRTGLQSEIKYVRKFDNNIFKLPQTDE